MMESLMALELVEQWAGGSRYKPLGGLQRGQVILVFPGCIQPGVTAETSGWHLPCQHGTPGHAIHQKPQRKQDASHSNIAHATCRPQRFRTSAQQHMHCCTLAQGGAVWVVVLVPAALIRCPSCPTQMNAHETLKRIKYKKVDYPADLSPGAIDFMKMALVRDPEQRGSIDLLLNHPWIRAFTKKRENLAKRNHTRRSRTVGMSVGLDTAQDSVGLPAACSVASGVFGRGLGRSRCCMQVSWSLRSTGLGIACTLAVVCAVHDWVYACTLVVLCAVQG
jgi:hypothetical protein